MVNYLHSFTQTLGTRSQLNLFLLSASEPTSRAPPWTFLMPIIFRDISSSRETTASTTILEKNSFCPAISLEFSAVAAHFSSSCLCSLRRRKHNTRDPTVREEQIAAAEGGGRSLPVVLLHGDGDLLDLVDGEVGGGAEGSDDGLRVEALLHVRLQLLQELCGQEGDGRGAVSDLRID